MFPQMFPCLPTRRNIVAETKFASREAKMFPIKFRNISCFPSVIFVAKTLFPSVCPSLETWRNIGRKQCFRNNVSRHCKRTHIDQSRAGCVHRLLQTPSFIAVLYRLTTSPAAILCWIILKYIMFLYIPFSYKCVIVRACTRALTKCYVSISLNTLVINL